MKKYDPRYKDKPYSGILTEETFWPIERNPIGIEKDVTKRIFLDKLAALLDHYGISGGLDKPQNGWLLAFELACDLVPKFFPTPHAPPKPNHRPYDPHVGERDLILYLELSNAEHEEGRSVRQAARDLAEQWQKDGTCDWDWKTLRSRYYRLRKTGPTEGMENAERVFGGTT